MNPFQDKGNLRQPIGARLSEYLICQTIQYGLQKIYKNIDETRSSLNIMDELFRSQPEEFQKQAKEYIRTHPNITVDINYPRQSFVLPFISVVNGSGGQDPQMMFLGHETGMQFLGSETVRRQKGTGLACNTKVYVAAQDPLLCLVLHWIVFFILFSNVENLIKRDIHDLFMTDQDLQWTPEFYPNFCFISMWNLSYKSFFDYNLSEGAKKIIDLSLEVATGTTLYPGNPNEEGEDPLLTDVPDEDE